ncbi:MAG TPA: SRPBCC family protein [Longimicrobiaceae bacterium]|nr:SRPBCC family protein [Longimicrobiaceae bacterium]
MPRIRAWAAATLAAPPEKVYGILADYRGGHPAILPERWFRGLEVERGGTGAGTVIRFRIRLGGSTRTVRAEVTEPEPGRVLAETDLETGAVTSFTVDPLDRGRRSAVTISTEWESPAPRAWIERLLAPPLLRRVYAEELRRLAEHAAR